MKLWERTPSPDENGTTGWQSCSNLDFREVEDLLDWLEVRGFTRREIQISDDQQSMTVRWKL